MAGCQLLGPRISNHEGSLTKPGYKSSHSGFSRSSSRTFQALGRHPGVKRPISPVRHDTNKSTHPANVIAAPLTAP